MGQLKSYCLRINVDPATGIVMLDFVCGESETGGHRKALTLETTARQLTPAELSGTLQAFLTSQQGQLEAKLL